MRARNVVHLHTVNRMQSLGWPLITTAIALLVVILFGVVIAAANQRPGVEIGLGEAMQWNGAIFALLGPLIGLGFTSMGQHFPLALGLGITRREYATGAGGLFLLYAAAVTVLVTVGKIVERATDGFGLQIRFFDVVYTSTGSIGQTVVQTFLLITAVLFVGAALTAAFLRWGQPFVWITISTIALVAVGLVALGLLVEGAGSRILEALSMGWGPWMGVTAAVAVLAAAVWLLLVRRTQVR